LGGGEMKIMDKLIIYPENEQQLTAIKAILSAMNIDFEMKNGDYPDYVIDGVRASLRQADEGQLIPYTGIRNMLNMI
jgi:hypothetical protein